MVASHSERCRDCKKTIETLLKRIYGLVRSGYTFDAGTNPDVYGGLKFHAELEAIFSKLERYRGHRDFVRVKVLPACDFFIPGPGFVVEFDESQHFTIPRKIALERYPGSLETGFSLQDWIARCNEIQAKDNDPPYRDEQRAWYDTLRDFLPVFKKLRPTVRLFSRAMQWCSLSPENAEDVNSFRRLVEEIRPTLAGWVATVIVQSNRLVSNECRFAELSQIVNLILQRETGQGVIVFPGGWFSAGKENPVQLCSWVERKMAELIEGKAIDIKICVGVDGRVAKYPRDQYAVALSKKGIEALGRKFHPAPEEKRSVDLADKPVASELGRPRIFELNGRRFFLCACYDSFGIRQRSVANPGVDVVIDLVHGFRPKGEQGSGDVYFAKHGFAGAAKEWHCLVFGAAVFFKREIPEDWPSGVSWNQGIKSTKEWRYSDNPVRPSKKITIAIEEGAAQIRIFNLSQSTVS